MTNAFALQGSDLTCLQDDASRAGQPGIPAASVRQQLNRVLSSRTFARSPRISRFLGFVVDQVLAGNERKLKEYLLGVEVFNRSESFDPRIDSIVRVEARRLRFKLEKYYETEGRDDTVHILMRKGCYVPEFDDNRPNGHGRPSIFEFPNLKTIDNPQAFGLHARGRHFLGSWTPDGIAESISCFSQALREDPDCASARAGLAIAWTLASLLGIMSPRDVAGKARQYAAEAVRLRSDCAEGHAVRGCLSALHELRWDEAEDRLRRSVPMDPGNVGIRLMRGLCASLAGRPEDAAFELRRAQQYAPTSVAVHLAAGFACHLAGSFEEALADYRLARDLAPSLWAAHLALGLIFADQHRHDQALNALARAGELSPRNPNVMCVLAYAQAAAGHTEAARIMAAGLAELATRQYIPPFCLGLADSALGDVGAAFAHLESAWEERSPWLALVRVLPAFAAVRADARYPSFAARIGLAGVPKPRPLAIGA